MGYDPGYKVATKVEEIPKEPHNAILEESYTSGDDGWGGSSTTNYLRYLIFDTSEALQSWVEQTEANNSTKYGSKTVYKVLQVKPLEVKKTVTINLE